MLLHFPKSTISYRKTFCGILGNSKNSTNDTNYVTCIECLEIWLNPIYDKNDINPKSLYGIVYKRYEELKYQKYFKDLINL